MLTIDLEALFTRLEKAVDDHQALMRNPLRSPHLRLSRDGATIHISVKLKGSRKIRCDDITGHGDTPEEAVAELIAGLDSWAEAIR